jgi:hypothetical protein
MLVVILIAGCTESAVRVDAGHDAGHDAGQNGPGDSGSPMDSGTDAGPIADSGVDSGLACACSGVSPCCPDGCNPAPMTTECSSVNGPQDCYPDSYIAPGWRGYDETVTHCGAAGACDGAQTVIEHRYSCPDGCARIVALGQANCL